MPIYTINDCPNFSETYEAIIDSMCGLDGDYKARDIRDTLGWVDGDLLHRLVEQLASRGPAQTFIAVIYFYHMSGTIGDEEKAYCIYSLYSYLGKDNIKRCAQDDAILWMIPEEDREEYFQ